MRTAVALAALLVVGVAAAAMLASKAGAPALESTGVATPGVAGAVARMAVPPPAPEGASAEAAAASEAPAAQEAAPPSASGSAAGATAESLFARANEARRRGDDAAAIRLYRELRARFPESRESAVAGPLLGQLLLDEGAPDKALSEFDGYLDKDKGGAVTEEALVGRANALMRMGKAPEERAAWQTLLAKYPRTVHAARARQRLAELH